MNLGRPCFMRTHRPSSSDNTPCNSPLGLPTQLRAPHVSTIRSSQLTDPTPKLLSCTLFETAPGCKNMQSPRAVSACNWNVTFFTFSSFVSMVSEQLELLAPFPWDLCHGLLVVFSESQKKTKLLPHFFAVVVAALMARHPYPQTAPS